MAPLPPTQQSLFEQPRNEKVATAEQEIQGPIAIG
jgi:hypothetical protein